MKSGGTKCLINSSFFLVQFLASCLCIVSCDCIASMSSKISYMMDWKVKGAAKRIDIYNFVFFTDFSMQHKIGGIDPSSPTFLALRTGGGTERGWFRMSCRWARVHVCSPICASGRHTHMLLMQMESTCIHSPTACTASFQKAQSPGVGDPWYRLWVCPRILGIFQKHRKYWEHNL